jgi:hypothetical protein
MSVVGAWFPTKRDAIFSLPFLSSVKNHFSPVSHIFVVFHVSSLHWSLVIICFPDKKDESGPIILHLDSLGFHCSSTVFSNIKR